MAQHLATKKKAERGAADAAPTVDDLKTIEGQDKILHPKPTTVSIFGDKIELHPLPARWSARFVGFAARVIGASSDVKVDNGMNPGIASALRYAVVLSESYSDDFLPYLARASNPTDAIVPDAQVAKIVAEMSSKVSALNFLPLALAFVTMVEQNEVVEALQVGWSQDPKN